MNFKCICEKFCLEQEFTVTQINNHIMIDMNNHI